MLFNYQKLCPAGHERIFLLEAATVAQIRQTFSLKVEMSHN